MSFRSNLLRASALKPVTALSLAMALLLGSAAILPDAVRADANNLWRAVGTKRVILDEALDHLDSLRLVDDALKLVRELPYGRQRLVEIAIALAQKPRVLLLDEPAAGVPSSESHLILDVVAALDPDIAVLIIEHDMDVVFTLADRISVLVNGAVLASGTPADVRANAEVRTAYLGDEN